MVKTVSQDIVDAFENLLATEPSVASEAYERLAVAVSFDPARFGLSNTFELAQVRAAVVATAVHIVQADKSGAAYIDHPARVFRIARDLSLPTATLDEHQIDAALCAALLHDVVEDSGKDFYRQVTTDDLTALGFSEQTVDLVKLLTYNKSQQKDEYLRAIAANPLARLVKLADTCDNMNKHRQSILSDEKQAEFAAKYGNYMSLLNFDPGTEWFATSINSRVIPA